MGGYGYALLGWTRREAIFTVGVLTISDGVSQGTREDESGKAIERVIAKLDSRVTRRAVVPDERDKIATQFKMWADTDGLDLVLSTGGTGLAPRDVTPEATKDVIDREVPGLAEMMRTESVRKNIHAVLSRAVAGTRRHTLIINLPGSPRAVEETLSVLLPVLPHALEILQGKQADHTPPAMPEHNPQHDHGGPQNRHGR